jgi:P4 family phage/plasmid primase-like protien
MNVSTIDKPKASTVTIKAPAKSFSDYLNRFYIKKEDITDEKPITNTRIGGGQGSGISGGTYHIPEPEYESFMQKLYKEVIRTGAKEYLTETQRSSGGPIVVDIDLRFKYEVTERIYQKDHVEDLLLVYLKELQQIFQFDETVKFPIFVFEKKTVNRLEDKKITKDGIHIIFGINADRAVQCYLRKQVMKEIAEVWSELPIMNTWDDVFDEGISIGTTNWQLIGCRKPNHDAYELKYVYDVGVDPTDGEVTLPESDPAKYMTVENISKLSVRYTKHANLFMKSDFLEIYDSLKGTVGTKRKVNKPTGGASTGNSDDNINLSDILQIRNAEQLQKAVDYFLESLSEVDYELREAHDYVMTLPSSYFTDGSFTKWIRVGWALRNISNKLFIVWVKFSAKAPKFEYSSIRDDLWPRWTTFDMNSPNGLTKRSIMHWSKKEAYEEYRKILESSVEYFIDQTIDIISVDSINSDKRGKGCGDYDIARVLYQLKKDEYACVSVKGCIWYRYKNHRWAEIDSGTTLRKAISEELRDIYTKKALKIQSVVCTLDSEDEKKKILQARINKILEICGRLGRTNDKKNIMTEARELFYDGQFLKKLDTNPYLICFRNGVIDFKEKRFRSGYPEDYLSRCTNIDYAAPDPVKDGKIMGEIRDFMHKLFPVKELHDYMWDHLASTMMGLTTNQTFNMYIGIGQNGKSVLVNLMEKILGDYKGDVPLSLITQPRTKIGSASPEIAALRGIRYAVMQEPSKGDKIIEGQLKALTGGDPLTGRALYMDNVTFIPQFKLTVCSNEFMDIKSNDHGTWRRICVVEFQSLFTDNPVSGDIDKPYQFKLDKNINEKFTIWAPVFAAMLVDRVFETNGNVAIPDIVKAASNAYRERQDYIAEFVHDRIAKHPNECLQKNMLASAFKEWYSVNYGNRIPNMKEITAYMDKQYGKPKNGVWMGVGLIYDNVPNFQKGTDDEDIDEVDLNEL